MTSIGFPLSTLVVRGVKNHRITESQNGRGWKGPLWITQSNPPAEVGSPTAGCIGPCPGGSWISPEKETPQPPWAACSSALSPAEWRNYFTCSDGTSCASFCAHCPLSCRWAPLKESGPVLLTPTLKIFIGISKIPSQSLLLQAKQSQLPQPFLIREMLRSPNQNNTLLSSQTCCECTLLKHRNTPVTLQRGRSSHCKPW